jgi:hypothetical protein
MNENGICPHSYSTGTRRVSQIQVRDTDLMRLENGFQLGFPPWRLNTGGLLLVHRVSGLVKYKMGMI